MSTRTAMSHLTQSISQTLNEFDALIEAAEAQTERTEHLSRAELNQSWEDVQNWLLRSVAHLRHAAIEADVAADLESSRLTSTLSPDERKAYVRKLSEIETRIDHAIAFSDEKTHKPVADLHALCCDVQSRLSISRPN